MNTTIENQPRVRRALFEVERIHDKIVSDLNRVLNPTKDTWFVQGDLIDEESTTGLIDFYSAKKVGHIDAFTIGKVVAIPGVTSYIISAGRRGKIPKGACSLRIRIVIDAAKFREDGGVQNEY